MANTIKNVVSIEVLERQKVTYQKHQFLFFSWYTKENTDRIGRDIVIETNDLIDRIYFNGQLMSR
jgi:hypothetical protein